jgi:hypothetical protein
VSYYLEQSRPDVTIVADLLEALVEGNADPEMLLLGFPILPTNDEDGAAFGIESRLLGPGPKNERG